MTEIDRSWPDEESITKAHDFLEPIERTWSKFDFSKCKHECWQVFYCGPYSFCVCVTCGKCIEKWCEHALWEPDDSGMMIQAKSFMEWNKSQTMLRCSNCGYDGT